MGGTCSKREMRQLGRHNFIFEDNSKMDLREVWFVGLDWIHLVQDRLF
jgi:hypothetical protein